MPMRYALVEDEPWKSRNMNKALVDNYVVYYTVNEDILEVMVIRIFYSGRDLKEQMK